MRQRHSNQCTENWTHNKSKFGVIKIYLKQAQHIHMHSNLQLYTAVSTRWICFYETTSTTPLTRAKWNDATSCNGAEQVTSLLASIHSHEFHTPFLDLNKHLLQEMQKYKHSKKIWLAWFDMSHQHSSISLRVSRREQDVRFFHVANMIFSFPLHPLRLKNSQRHSLLQLAKSNFKIPITSGIRMV